MIRTYLDWVVSVPWDKVSEDQLDPVHTREVLDADHAGLEDVKDRIVEYVAVKKLRQDRGMEVSGDGEPTRPRDVARSGRSSRSSGPRHRQDLHRRVDRPGHGP